jgi:phosphonate transport system substrate-binding protein
LDRLRYLFLAFLVLFLFTNELRAQELEVSFAISPKASPVANLSIYSDFIKYLSKKTGYKLGIKQRSKYSEINTLLETGEAQFALSSTGAFLSGKSEFGLEALAVPVINGKTSYHSLIIVNKESDIREIYQLKGGVFAFTDPISLSGKLYPQHLLNLLGIKQKDFFKRAFFTSGHDKSIESVAIGLADGAAVCSLIYDDLKRWGAPNIDSVKIIKISPPYGIPPIVVSPLADSTAKHRILRTLIKMNADLEGKKILDRINIDKFVLPDPAAYSTAQRLRQAGFLP